MYIPDEKYILVITGGPKSSDVAALISEYAIRADSIICADSGVDDARQADIKVDCVYGDLDSISAAGLEYIEKNSIPVHKFPCEKDMTDTELVLSSIPDDRTVVLVCSLRGRIDHVTANLMLCARYVSLGRNIILTDGSAYVFYLNGEDNITCNLPEEYSSVISLLPMSMTDRVTGVCTAGLYYELDNAELSYGSSLGVSNKAVEGGKMFSISQKSGIMGVFVAPEE